MIDSILNALGKSIASGFIMVGGMVIAVLGLILIFTLFYHQATQQSDVKGPFLGAFVGAMLGAALSTVFKTSLIITVVVWWIVGFSMPVIVEWFLARKHARLLQQEEVRKIKEAVDRLTGGPDKGLCRQVQSLYSELGLEFGASLKEVKGAYRALAKQYHPDVLSQQMLSEEMLNAKTSRFTELTEAYHKLLEIVDSE